MRGMTLIEMLVVIAIIGMIMPALYASIANLYATHGKTFARSLALFQASEVAKAVVRDVRGAVYAEDGALPIVSIATSSITLFTDTDYDGRIERVRYTLTGTTLVKGIIEPTAGATYPTASETTTTIATNIMNNDARVSLFRYYSATSTEITTMSSTLSVRRVDVEVVGASDQNTSSSTRVTIGSSASIRNLKDSY
jgi:prepilin-type N-terminal cleavage/methylation domain-containing protein